jgi:hypothetical protein
MVGGSGGEKEAQNGIAPPLLPLCPFYFIARPFHELIIFYNYSPRLHGRWERKGKKEEIYKYSRKFSLKFCMSSQHHGAQHETCSFSDIRAKLYKIKLPK